MKHLSSLIKAVGIVAVLNRLAAGPGLIMTWRLFAKISILIVILFSFMVILLEALPSWKTTFIATIETSRLNFRLAENVAILEGISGRTIEILDSAQPAPTTDPSGPLDLTMIGTEVDRAESNALSIAARSEESRLEVDELRVPSGRAVQVTTSGAGSYLSIEVMDETETEVDVRLVWHGEVVDTKGPTEKTLPELGSASWSGKAPSLAVDKPAIDQVSFVPIKLANVDFEILRHSGGRWIRNSAVLQGTVEFDIAGQPARSVPLREGEFVAFRDLEAQLLNLSMTDRGLRFVLVGRASSVAVGFSNPLRDIHPSMLDAVRSRPSANVIGSALFAILLALLSAAKLGRPDEEKS